MRNHLHHFVGGAALVALLSSCLLGLAVPFASIQGNGIMATESRSVGSFSSVDVAGAARVHISRGAPGILIRTDSNLIPELETTVRSGALHIHWKPGISVHHMNELFIEISMPELAGIAGSGATSFEIETFSGSGLKLSLSGASSVAGVFEYDKVDADASGASRISLRGGAADSLSADLSGASRLAAGSFSARDVRLGASGASFAVINVISSLSCGLSGASRLEYRGSPSITDIRSSGGSSASRLAD